MKLAEALIERADVQRHLAQLQVSVAHLGSVCAERTHGFQAALAGLAKGYLKNHNPSPTLPHKDSPL